MLQRLLRRLHETNLTLVILGMVVTLAAQDGQDAYLQAIFSVLLYGLLSLLLFIF